MNAFINYVIEANLGLLFFAAIYGFVFRSEHPFSVKRFYLLAAISISLVFPFFHFDLHASAAFVPSLGQIVPTYWLPEIVITPNGTTSSEGAGLPLWSIIEWVYRGVVLVFTLVFLIQLFNILQLYLRSKKYSWKQCLVCESSENKPTFSFFRFIFIGQVGKLTPQEKEDILLHEFVHVHKFHSLDILFVTVVGILFWFNPIVRFYKSALFQLHEFEADAVAIENKDVDAYCSLLSKLTLDAVGYPLAHHFNHSLTIKRINMMKAIKQKIQTWKLIAIMGTVPVFFFVVACRDQVVQKSNGEYLANREYPNSLSAEEMPTSVRSRLAALHKQYPKSEFIVVEQTTPEGNKTLTELWKRKDIGTMNFIHEFTGEENEKIIERQFTIVEITDRKLRRASLPKNDKDLFNQVDESAAPVLGIDMLYTRISQVLQYPPEARLKGIQGTVQIEFVVGTDGKISDVRIAQSVDEYLDAEAIRVVLQVGNEWDPAIHQGQVVRQKFMMPIIFSLDPIK